MSALYVKPRIVGMAIPAIKHIEILRPLVWLRLGWGDFRLAWPASLTYGLLFAALGWLLMAWARDSTHLTLALLSGFALVAPFLAIGFYASSSRIEHGLDPRGPFQFIMPLRRNPGSIGLFALMLAFMLSVWERLSAVLVGLFLKHDLVANGYFSLGLLFKADHLGFVIAYLVLGAMLAGLVFCLAAVSLPLMMDRPVDMVTAVITSLWTVLRNPLPMLVWAGIIVALTLIGLLTAMVSLVILFPLLGHATWHAYRDLVEAG